MTLTEYIAKVTLGSRWRHYKGTLYVVKGLGRLETTQELVVIYSSIEDPTVLWVRPLNNWLERLSDELLDAYRLKGPLHRFEPEQE